ncbi:hypothetical protein BDFB_006563 [Asbolus verrucosus]|uniref:Coiled-coil domain-containing protein 181 n=1 Tax=Asbolus verrucosus TaxID=1661398 RepID=A0A482VN08_ASBVE|nr:hypothetical protein BDFB_006563 [Asbolus verrucosus]
MDLIVDKLQNGENEDDDYGSYFLQPASSPYNIAEKVQQANIDLFSSNNLTMEKTSRVTFKEQLTSYEPELLLTDDDVNSLESDPPEAELIPEGNQILEYKSSNVINLNIFDINEDEEEEEDDDDDDEEVIEDIEPEECEELTIKNITDDNKTDLFDEFNDEDTDKTDATVTVRISSSNEGKKSSSKRKKTRKKSPSFKPSKSGATLVECKSHCIERLDFDLSMSIKKLEIHEKPVKCPLLKLQRRKCCDENRARNPTNLPCYNGHRSEYGLSSAELEKRERRREIIKLKEQKRQELMREYKNRKNQQNEAVFCQWLKDVARRKVQKQKIDKCGNDRKQYFSPNVISFPTKVCEKATERPKTANEFVPRQNIKRTRRPHTSPACVFIEVPHKMLERGIHIGDLLVSNSNHAAKKMHILTVST